ncbi:hypothetical protein Tco_0044979 [Tanacetum coccineum]
MLLNLGSLDLTLVIAIPTVLVLVPTILIVGLVVVLHGRKTGRLAENNIGRYSEGGSARTHFSNNGFASGVTNFGLALDDA